MPFSSWAKSHRALLLTSHKDTSFSGGWRSHCCFQSQNTENVREISFSQQDVKSNLFRNFCQVHDRWICTPRSNKSLGHQSGQPRELLLFHMRGGNDFLGVSQGWAGRQVLLQDRSHIVVCAFARGVRPCRVGHIDTSDGAISRIFLSLRVFVFFFLRWGCREHFVSGCWHSSGRDCGRYTRECWLSTLGVLHPGVPVMWYAHIRDLSPTAEAVRGSCAQWNEVALGKTKVMLWCRAVMIWTFNRHWHSTGKQVTLFFHRCFSSHVRNIFGFLNTRTGLLLWQNRSLCSKIGFLVFGWVCWESSLPPATFESNSFIR